MTKRKRPRDPSQLAKLIVDIAAGEVEDRPPTPEEQGKDSAATSLGKRGGLARAKRLGAVQNAVYGEPDPAHISTSFAERSNLTTRMNMRRFTRLTNAFSKKIENHAHAVALHMILQLFFRIHKTLRFTPAMAAGVTDKLWEISDIVVMLEKWEAAN